MSMARFIEIWTSGDYPPEPVAEADLHGVEQHLGIQLPEDYKKAVLQAGLPRPTIALLDAIVERELDLHDLGDFHSPSEIIEQTLAWRDIGMPEQLVAFASDSCGNKFCFDTDEMKKGSAEGCGIWFYDHDFDAVNQIALGFDAWIDAFCDVAPWPEAESS